MSEQMKQALSALMDGETEDREIELLLERSDDPALRGTWMRYQAAGQVMRGTDAIGDLRIDISARVREAVAGVEPEPAADEAPQITPVARSHNFFSHRVLRPVASFAVAASVFAAVLVVTQWYGLLSAGDAADGAVQVASRPAPPVGMVNTAGGSAMVARYAAPAVKSTAAQQRAAYDRLARQRLQRYLLPHTEEASLNTPQGMMPYARLATFRSED